MIATHVPPLRKDATTSLGWCMPRYIRVSATPTGTISSSVHQATFAPVLPRPQRHQHGECRRRAPPPPRCARTGSSTWVARRPCAPPPAAAGRSPAWSAGTPAPGRSPPRTGTAAPASASASSRSASATSTVTTTIIWVLASVLNTSETSFQPPVRSRGELPVHRVLHGERPGPGEHPGDEEPQQHHDAEQEGHRQQHPPDDLDHGVGHEPRQYPAGVVGTPHGLVRMSLDLRGDAIAGRPDRSEAGVRPPTGERGGGRRDHRHTEQPTADHVAGEVHTERHPAQPGHHGEQRRGDPERDPRRPSVRRTAGAPAAAPRRPGWRSARARRGTSSRRPAPPGRAGPAGPGRRAA